MKPELLKDFKQLYYSEFGEELSDDDVLAKALDLVSLFRVIYRPIPIVKKSLYNKFTQWYNKNSGPISQ